jgi:hypothetical protein
MELSLFGRFGGTKHLPFSLSSPTMLLPYSGQVGAVSTGPSGRVCSRPDTLSEGQLPNEGAKKAVYYPDSGITTGGELTR